jgi:hypothetical protein
MLRLYVYLIRAQSAVSLTFFELKTKAIAQQILSSRSSD